MNDDPATIRRRRTDLLRAVGETPEVSYRQAKTDAKALLDSGAIDYTRAERRLHRKVLLTSLEPATVDEIAVERVLAGHRRFPDGTLMQLTEDERIEIDRRVRASGGTTYGVARVLCTSTTSVRNVERRATYHLDQERSA